MEEKNKKIIIFSIVLAVVTSLLIFIYLRNLKSSAENVEYLDVFIASKMISAKSQIREEDIKEIRIEKSLVNPDAILVKNEIIGKTTKENIYEGEQILKTRLADKYNSTLAYEIPKGKRAITINVNEASAVGYFIKPGDFVDLIVTFQKEAEDQKDKQIISPRISRTLLQNIQILGIGQDKDFVDKIVEANDKKSMTSSGDKEFSKTVTLAVTPQDAEKIAISEEAGILRMTLRPVGDNSTIDSSGVTKDELVPYDKKIIIYK